jgi:ATP-dependent exoDNAse (exonuclease V) beta subunit
MGKSDEFVAQSSESEFITGHIDLLQVRDGYLKILDYKPDARKERHAHVQPRIYALALARRTNLPLKSSVCMVRREGLFRILSYQKGSIGQKCSRPF